MLLRRPESNAKIRWRQQLVFQMNSVEIFGVKLGGEPFQAVMSHADEIVPDCERTAWLLSIPVQSSFSTEFLAKWPGDGLIESLWALLGIRLYFKWNYITNRLVHSTCCFRKQVSVTSEGRNRVSLCSLCQVESLPHTGSTLLLEDRRLESMMLDTAIHAVPELHSSTGCKW